MAIDLWWRRSTSIANVWLHLTLRLQSSGFGLDQCILNRANRLGRENWPRIYRARDGLFPSFEHSFHISSRITIDQSVCIHKDAEKIAT